MNEFFSSLSDRSYGEPSGIIRPRLDFRFEPASSTIEGEPAGLDASTQLKTGAQLEQPPAAPSPHITNNSVFHTNQETTVHQVENHFADASAIDAESPDPPMRDFGVESRLNQIESTINQLGSNKSKAIPFRDSEQAPKVEPPRLLVNEIKSELNIEPFVEEPASVPAQVIQEFHASSTSNVFTNENKSEQNFFNSQIQVAKFHQHQEVVAQEQHNHRHFLNSQINQQLLRFEEPTKAIARDSEQPKAKTARGPILPVEKTSAPKLETPSLTASSNKIAPPKIKVAQVGVQSKSQVNSTINVSIGQIEIRRPETRSGPAIQPSQASQPVSRIMSLDAYLNREEA